MHTPPLNRAHRRHHLQQKPGQSGRSLLSIFALTVLVALLGLGGWWWKNRADADPANAARPAASSPGGAGGNASGAGTSGPGGQAGPGAGGRRGAGPNRNQPVSVQQARKQDVRVIVNAIGNIVALNTAAVHSRVDGLITSVLIREGQDVKAGQALLQLDPAPFKAALESAQGVLARDQAQLDGAKVDLARYKALLAKDSIQSQQVDTQEALVKQLSGTVRADQAAVATAQLNLDWCTVKAPISGRLGLRAYDLGNMVHANDAGGIVTITQTRPIGATFTVPELNLAQVMRQVKSKTPMPVEVWDREQKRQIAVGTLLATDNAVDASTGTIRMKASFANKDESLFPNQFVNLRMQVDTIQDAITVPSNAVQRGAVGTFVYVVDNASGTVAMRKVRTGASDNDWVIVTGEVQAGDTVVTDGADRLRDGAKVEVIVPQASGPGGPGGGAGRRRDGAPGPRPAASGASASASASTDGATNSGAANARPASVSGTFNASAERPRWMDFLPPNTSTAEIEKIKAMDQEARRDYIRKLRQSQAQ